MKVLDILKNKEALFVIDDIEDKKTRELVKDLNNALVNIFIEYEEFNLFAAKQLNGEYHQKLVNVKSLKEHYGEWNGIKQAYIAYQKEEENKINKLYANKTTLINKLRSLANDCQKSLPVIASYHLSNGELVNSNEEHETIILGVHNANVIERIINELESDIVVEGNFDKVQSVELRAVFAIVEKNAFMCEDKINEVFANKPAKAEKLIALVNTMTEVAKNLVFYETYKTTMIDIGCPNKDMELLQKELLKKYIPLKKQLQKTLKLSFEDICDVIIDETEYQSDDSQMDTFEQIDMELSRESEIETSENSEEQLTTNNIFGDIDDLINERDANESVEGTKKVTKKTKKSKVEETPVINEEPEANIETSNDDFDMLDFDITEDNNENE